MSNPFRFFPFFSFWCHSNSFCPILPQSPWLEIISDHFVFMMLLKQSFTDAYNLFQAAICFSCYTAVLKAGVNTDLKTFYMALFGM